MLTYCIDIICQNLANVCLYLHTLLSFSGFVSTHYFIRHWKWKKINYVRNFTTPGLENRFWFFLVLIELLYIVACCGEDEKLIIWLYQDFSESSYPLCFSFMACNLLLTLTLFTNELKDTEIFCRAEGKHRVAWHFSVASSLWLTLTFRLKIVINPCKWKIHFLAQL